MEPHPLHLLMCQATEFDVNYEINPWMSKHNRPNRQQALAEQAAIVETLTRLGHRLEFIDPGASLPDMCFSANAGIARDKKVFLGHLPPERMPEITYYRDWFKAGGYEIKETPLRFGGGGDALWYGQRIIAGFSSATVRGTDIGVHRQLADFFDAEVISLGVTDARFYDLDMAVGILSPTQIAICMDVLDQSSQAKLRSLSDVELIEVSLTDAVAFGCNLISDGLNVLISDRATGLIQSLRDAGFNPLPHSISQFMLSGGGVRCLALNL